MKQTSKTAKRSKKPVLSGLNELEADIMDIVWDHKKITVRDVHEVMMEDGYIPYTTVMAAMNNMSLKGLLKQNRNGRAFVYSAAISREQMACTIMDAVIDRVLEGDRAVVVNYLSEFVEQKATK
jgi:predicted transcriptional regulator